MILKLNNKHNKSTYFLLPLIGVPFKYFNQGENRAFIETYSFNKEGERTNSIFVCVDFGKMDRELYEATVKHFESKYYVGSSITNIGSTFVITFEYSIPKHFLADLDLFYKGKYSHFSVSAKYIISKYVDKYTVDDEIKARIFNSNYLALFPNDEAKQALKAMLETTEEIKEIVSVPDFTKERLPNYVKI